MYSRLYKILVILLIAICNNVYGQECSPYKKSRTIWWEAKSPIRYSVSAGMCYHYDGYTAGLHYKDVSLQTVLMRPARYRTMRMQEEAYIVGGYDGRLGIGGGLRLNAGGLGPVGYVSCRQKIVGGLFGNVAYYQTIGMSHLVIGVKVML